MAEGKSPEVEKIPNLNQEGNEEWWVKTERKETAKMIPPEEPKVSIKPKAATLFPAKKRLVKKMMFDYIAHKFSAFFSGKNCFKFKTGSKAKMGKQQIHPK